MVTLLLLSLRPQAANRYVNYWSTGADNGTSWTNAWRHLNGKSLQSGDTVWFAGGNYADGEKGWASGFGITVSGVSIRRALATESACTSAAGWQASFDNPVTFTLNYSPNATVIQAVGVDNVTIDGGRWGGFRFIMPVPAGNPNTTQVSLLQAIRVWGNNITVRNVEVYCPVVTAGGNTGLVVGNNGAWPYKSGVTIEDSWFHDINDGLFVGDTHNVTMQRCIIGPTYGNGVNHDNGVYSNSGDYLTFRYNIMTRMNSSGFYIATLAWPTDHVYIYGNIFDRSPGGQMISFDPGGNHNATTFIPYGSDFRIFNNTFVDCWQPLRAWTPRFGGNNSTTGGEFANNLLINCGSGLEYGALSPDYNYSNGSISGSHSISGGAIPFVNLAGGDYHLAAGSGPINAGVSLGAPYNVDKDGITRGTDGAYDIGAYEYPAAGSAGSIRLSSPTASVSEEDGSITVIFQRVGGSAGSVQVDYATANGTATSPVNYTGQSGTKSWANADTADKTLLIPIADANFEGSKTFTITISNPTGGATLGQSTQTITITGSGSPAPCLITTTNFQAEAACSIATPMAIATAGGVTYIYQPTQIEPYTSSGRAVYTFTNAPGNYLLRWRVRAPTGGNNSFYVGLNDEEVDIADIVPYTGDGYEDRYVTYRGTNAAEAVLPPHVFALAAGTNTLTLYGREADTRVDFLTWELVPEPESGDPAVVMGFSTSLTNLPTYFASYRKSGDTIPITVSWSRPVTVTGTPELLCSAGFTANYLSGSGTTNLVFQGTVSGGQDTNRLDVLSISLNGGTLKTGSVDADLTIPVAAAAGSLSASQAIVIDTTAPTTAIGSPTLTWVDGRVMMVEYPVIYTDANLGRAPAAMSTNDVNVTLSGTLSVTNRVEGIPANPRVAFDYAAGSGTVKFSLGSGSAYDLAGNPAGAASESQAVAMPQRRITLRGVKTGTLVLP